MSWNLSLYGHNNDPETMESVIGIIRAAGYSIDAITDTDGGDTFGGTLPAPNVTISFPEPATEAAGTEASAADEAGEGGTTVGSKDAGVAEVAEE